MTRGLLGCFCTKPSATKPSPHTSESDDEPDEPEHDSLGLGPVLVELFSSQGCAASPQAEILVSRLGRGDFELDVPLVLLNFHVDYWDHMGWKDPLGSNQWSLRQRGYVEALGGDTLFTPQIVVQGRVPCLGTDQDAVLGNIASAARFRAPSLKASFQRITSDSLKVTLTGSLGIIIDSEEAEVMVALYEDNLVTNCLEGENKDRVLANDHVVRRLKKLCTVKEISAETQIGGIVIFDLWKGFSSGKCGVTLFVQSRRSLHILTSKNFRFKKTL